MRDTVITIRWVVSLKRCRYKVHTELRKTHLRSLPALPLPKLKVSLIKFYRSVSLPSGENLVVDPNPDTD